MKKTLTIFLLSGLILAGCAREDEKSQVQVAIGESSASIESGMLRVKLTNELGDSFTITNDPVQLKSGNNAMDSFLKEIGATSMERVFPYAGKYEERTRREGLHLWYDIKFDKNIPVTKAAADAHNISGIVYVEEINKIELPPHTMVLSDGEENSTRADALPFNDPKLTTQWHYKNIGEFPKSVAGADINAYEAWKKETGKPNVIVSVVDGGVDYTHEDIKDNMYVNLAELNGVEGVDDDNNGYIDDIYGFNFVTDTPKVTPDDHGTHVAGTVAARNNNGIGVCGVAGGDGTPNSGARILSCQIFEGDNGGNSQQAIKYGADNGAVISQNSWGYRYPGPTTIPPSIKEAIDYFIKYAGCDNNGNQLPDSPMKGGVVIFAAGNDDKDYLSFPGAYPPVVSVSAMAPDFKKAWYTNRGDWVTIMAPGGDQYFTKGMVYSLAPKNGYAYMQGTSMACPHVSGIAALVVSKYGKQGFTNEDLKKHLITAFRPQNIDENNPGYVGRLGAGYIDADKALSENQNKKPGKVGQVLTVADYKSIDISFAAVSDEDDNNPNIYKLYFSYLEELNASNYKSALFTNIPGATYKPGETVKYTLRNASIGSKYSFAIIAEDRWGLQSEPTFFSATTKQNNPPTITAIGAENIRVTGNEIAEVRLIVNDPDDQEWTFVNSGDTKGVSIVKSKEGLLVSIKATATIGKYQTIITVSDVFLASTSIKIPFEVYKNNPPQQIKEFEKQFIPVTKKDFSINLLEYFNDPDGQVLKYTITQSGTSVATASISENTLKISANAIGNTSFIITASDSQNAKVSATVNVQIVKEGLVYIVYPIPATTVLNVRLSDEVESATITIYTTTGTQVLKQIVNTKESGTHLLAMDIAKLAPSTYVLQVVSGGKTYKQNFIKK